MTFDRWVRLAIFWRDPGKLLRTKYNATSILHASGSLRAHPKFQHAVKFSTQNVLILSGVSFVVGAPDRSKRPGSNGRARIDRRV